MKKPPRAPEKLPDPSELGDGIDLLFDVIKKRMLAIHDWSEKYKKTWGKECEFSRNIDVITVFNGASAYLIKGEVYIGKTVTSLAEFPRSVFIEKGSAKKGFEFFFPGTEDHLVYDSFTKTTVSHVVKYHVMKDQKGLTFITNPWDDDTYDVDGRINKINEITVFMEEIRNRKIGKGFTIIKERTEEMPTEISFATQDQMKADGITIEQAKINALAKLVDDCLVQACNHALKTVLSEENLSMIVNEIDEIYIEIFEKARERLEKNNSYKKMLDGKEPVEELDELFEKWREKKDNS